MQTYPKRLIEVDLPIARISAHARREKSIRHGHISTLHIWWARRPLAACRAVICAALWPDPADEKCPQAFRDAAARYIVDFARQADGDLKLLATSSDEGKARWAALVKTPMSPRPTDEAELLTLRAALLDFIADFANWDNSTSQPYLETSRALTQAAYEALGGEPGTRPLVVDPFAGGGSIPLESLRVGADAFASDLNPIAVLLNKVVLEYIPRYGQRLTDEVRRWGGWVRDRASRELAVYYPAGPEGTVPFAFIWGRTVTCEGPRCGAKVPLIKSLWLGKKPHNPWSLRLHGDPAKKTIAIEIVRLPVAENRGEGTVQRGSVTCPVCGYTTPSGQVRKQLLTIRGGASSATLLCAVATPDGEVGRVYRLPSDEDLRACETSRKELERRVRDGEGALVPDEPTPPGGGRGAGRAFSQRGYGMATFDTLYTPRQMLAITTLCKAVQAAGRDIAESSENGLREAVQALLAFNVDKMADYGSALASWASPATKEHVRSTFSRQALSITWDFAETNPFSSSSGGWDHNLDFVIGPVERESAACLREGTAVRADAAQHPLPDDSADAFITDPPYYDAIPYADLSDFFAVWLKRSLHGTALRDMFASLSPKDQECVVDEVKGHDHAYFERKMRGALSDGRRVTRWNGVGVVVFAHKSTSGWEAQLQALVDAGWIITGSWPLDTERQGRLRANAAAALASSVHLICRPRENPDGSLREEAGEWRDVLTELPVRIHEWMPRLAQEGVVGADAIFACLGPALEVFSRYSRVEKASGEAATLREYLEHVWAAVSTEALSMIFEDADAAGLEPDARLTAMWLWTLGGGSGRGATNGKANGSAAQPDANDTDEDSEAEDEDADEAGGKGGKVAGYLLEFDAARKIAQGLGIHLEKSESIVEVKGDKARLRPVSERTQHLFGKDTEAAPTGRGRKKAKPKQKTFFEELDEVQAAEAGWGELKGPPPGSTVLDRLHQAMILFAAGRGELLKRFLVEEGVGTDARFWKLAQSLSALYPRGSDEKRWVDGVLARKKGLGF